MMQKELKNDLHILGSYNFNINNANKEWLEMMYFLLGVLAPIILNLLHLVVGVYVVTARGSIMSLGFTGMGFLTKTIALLWLTWLGVSIVELDYKIYVPLLTFFWFFTHLVEAFVIQHYMGKNVPKHLEDMQL